MRRVSDDIAGSIRSAKLDRGRVYLCGAVIRKCAWNAQWVTFISSVASALPARVL